MQRIYRHPVILVLAFFVLTTGCYQVVLQQLLQHNRQVALQHGFEFNQYLNQQIQRFSTLTDTLARRPELRALLAGTAPDAEQKLAVSILLADFNLASGSASVYLMDHSGLVLSSSNYDQPVHFVGYNFGFRPYFTETLAQQRSYIDYGVGWISNERGIYFAAMVTDTQLPQPGVLVLKLNMDQIEQAYQAIAGQSKLIFMLVDQHNKVLASNHKPWQLSHFGTEAQPVPAHPGKMLTPLKRRQRDDFWQLLAEPQNKPTQFTEYAVAAKDNLLLPWQLLMLQPAATLRLQALQLTTSLGLLFAVLVLFAVYWRNRRQQQRQQARIFSQLEQAVAERTQSLQHSNEELQYQILQRTEAEQELRQTQAQLLQAAKLATIGQLSASINHELNQPLTAMHSYLQTSQKMLSRGMYPQLADNLDKLSQLLLRLNHTVQQFKSFSRKAPNQPQAVKLEQVLLNALGIVQPAVNQHRAKVKLLNNSNVCVNVDPLQLEQVLVNLLGNAVQAIEHLADPRLQIRITEQDDIVILQIKDNGAGIQPHNMVHLFEPFFTTKQGNGLGLGLCISRQIVQSYNGQLSIDNHPEGGAIVALTLPKLPAEHLNVTP